MINMSMASLLVLALTITVALSGCATYTTLDQKREKVLDCTKDLMDHDSIATDAFEVCHHIYRLRKIGEK